MVKHFRFGDPSQAGFYSGILVSSFSIAEALVCPLWGALSDRIGRKPVLLVGMFGTMLSIIMMGFATNFWFALAARILGGALNGNIGVIQTIVGEICRNPEHEPRAFALMPIVWLMGTIIGPSIAAFSIGKVWPQMPYLLPNLICALILAIAIVAGWVLLKETHPDLAKKEDIVDVLEVSYPNTPVNEYGPDGSYGTFGRNDSEVTLTGPPEALDDCDTMSLLSKITSHQAHLHHNADGEARETSSLLSKIQSHSAHPHHHNDADCHHTGATFTRRVLQLFGALALFAYHSMCFDHLLPILLLDPRGGDNPSAALPTGGLGFTISQVGMVTSANGVLALIVQIVVFPPLANRFGVFRLFQLAVLAHPLVYFLPPFLTALPINPVWVTYAGLLVELVVRNMATIVLYPLLLILIKEAAPRPSVLGRINGVAASCGAFTRALAPPIAGWFYGLGERNGIAGLAWWSTMLVAVVACAQLLFIARAKTVVVDEDGYVHADGLVEEEEGHKHVTGQQILIAEVDSD